MPWPSLLFRACLPQHSTQRTNVGLNLKKKVLFIDLIIIFFIYQIYIVIQRQFWVAQFLVAGGRITKGIILKGF